MKTKIKRHYRSAVSVLLSVCMLISCMTVGLIATDAAKVTNDEAVGAAPAEGTTVFIKPGAYTSTDESYYAYIFDDSADNAWVPLNRITSGYYNTYFYFTVPAGTYNTITIVRKASGSAGGWDTNVYNQTQDCAFVGNYYQIGTWKSYSESPQKETLNGTTRVFQIYDTVSNSSSDLTDTGNGVYTYSGQVTANSDSVGFKFNDGSNWYGYSGGNYTFETENGVMYDISATLDIKNVYQGSSNTWTGSTFNLSPAETRYTVTLDTDGHGTVTPASKQVGATAQSLPVPTPDDGYVFSGWTTTDTSTITLTNPTDPASATVSASDTGTVTANFVPNTSMNLYIAGRFRVRNSAGSDQFTYTFGTNGDGQTGNWNETSTFIPFVYTGSGTVYKVDTYSSIGELSANIGADYSLEPVFFVYDKTNSSNTSYYATAATPMTKENAKGTASDKVTLATSGANNNLKFADTAATDSPVTIFYDANTHELWYKTTDPLNDGLYSLSGNVTDKYIVGSEIVKPKNIDTSTWWSTFHKDLAIDEVVGSAGDGTFKIVFTTTEYEGGINIGLAGRDGVQYAFYYNGTAYNTNSGDLDLTTEAMKTAGSIENVYVYDVDSTNPGGSLKLMPNTTYTITIDQTKRLNDNDDNPLGKMTIAWNTVYANAIAMTSDFDINTRRYDDPEESATGGTASVNTPSGIKGDLDPTFSASANTGYTFAGWYSDPECTDLVSSEAPYSENNIEVEHTYYALFKQNKPETEHTVTVTIDSAGDYGSITPGPGLEFVSLGESGSNTVITFKAYDGANTYITATPKEATSSAIYELGTVTFSPAGAGSESNGKITLPNIDQDIAVTVPFSTRSYYTVTLTGTHGKITAQAKNADGSNYKGPNNSVSNVYTGTVNVPIGGRITLTAGDPDTNYEFSNFELVTGEYKRQSNQNTGTSPMTIRPLKDTTAEAVFTAVGSQSNYQLHTYNPNLEGHNPGYIGTIYAGSYYEYFKTTTETIDGYPIYQIKTTLEAGKEYTFNVKSLDSAHSSNNTWQKNNYDMSSQTGWVEMYTDTTGNTFYSPASTGTYTIQFYHKDESNQTPNWKNGYIKITKSEGGGPTIDTSGYRKIYAMDGVESGTANFGDTVIINPMGLLESDIEDDQGNSEAYVSTREKYNVYYYDPNREDEITFRVQTTIADHGSNQANEYLGVRGFVYNGKSVEAKDGGNGVYYADITMKASDVVDINGKNDVKNGSNYPILEIVPVYYNTTLDDEDDCVKFYVDANSMQNKYGFNLGYYAWYKDTSGPSGTDVQMSYPGQPLLKEGTKYYTYLPEKYTPNNQSGLGDNDLAGVLLDNLWEHSDAHKRVLESWGCVSTDANYQTFDYEDPLVIKDLEANIIEFVVKYEETNSNHRDGTHWYNNNTKYNKAENLKGKNASDYSHTIPITKPAGASRLNGFEQLRNYDNKPVDVYGNELTSAQNKYDDALFIVSVGNQTVAPANDWDTVWMIYDHDGNFIEASNPATYIEAATQSEAIKNKPAYINYEKFLDGYEKNQQYSDPQGTGNSGDRIDGRWLYSKSTDNSEAHIRVATLGKNGDTLNFMTFADGASGARIAYDDDSCDGLVQTNQRTPHPGYPPENTTQEDLFGRKTEFSDKKTKAKAVLNQPNGYKIVGFYMQKVGVLGDEEDNYFSLSKADYDVMDRESATVAKFTNARNNYIVAIVEKVPSSNLHLTHEMYGGTGAHGGAGQFYLKAEVLGPENASTHSRPVIASSNGFVNGSDGYEFEYLNGIARKVSSENAADHYMVRVTIRTVMAGTNTLYKWYSKDLVTGGYNEIDDNTPASYGQSGTQDKVILVDVNTLYGNKEDTFKYTNLDYYSDIEMPGTVYFRHLKTEECPGDGTLTTQVKVYDSSNAVIKTFESTGTVEVPPAWTGKDSGYQLEVTLIATPDSRSSYVSTYKEAAATNVVDPAPTVTDGVGTATPKIYPFAVPTGTKIPVSEFYNNIEKDPLKPPMYVFDTDHNTFTFYSQFIEANRTVNITKNLIGTDTTDAFTVKVETSENGTTWTDYSDISYTSTNTDHSGTTNGTGHASIYSGETISFTEVPIDAYVRITETGLAGKYQFKTVTAKKAADPTTDADRFTTDGITKGCTFRVTDDDVNVDVTNELEIAYEITYPYDSRSYLIPQSGHEAGTPKYGTPSYKVNGTGLFTDILELNEGTYRIKSSFVESNIPYEKNFMQNMQWGTYDYSKAKATNDAGYEEYYCSVTGTNQSMPTVDVTFYFPYESKSYTIRDYDNDDTTKTIRGTIYGPAGTPEALTEYDTQSYVAQPYQSNPIVYAIRTRTVDDGSGGTTTEKYDAKFGTFAAPSVGDKEFAYWSICARSGTDPGTNDNPNYVEVARCYEAQFNYALFDNYRVYAMYKGQDGVDEQAHSSAKYTTINFLGYSRNHWNNSDRGGYPESYNYSEGDVIWTDFDVAFNNGNELIVNNSNTEVGVLFTKVQDTLDEGVALDPGSDSYAVNYQYYFDKYNHGDEEEIEEDYKKSTWVDAAKTYILGTGLKSSTKDAGEGNIYSKRVLNSTLTNKNRTEYGYAWAVNYDAGSSEIINARRKGLYRAVTYIRIGDEVTFSETPVYICLSSEANKTPASPAP